MPSTTGAWSPTGLVDERSGQRRVRLSDGRSGQRALGSARASTAGVTTDMACCWSSMRATSSVNQAALEAAVWFGMPGGVEIFAVCAVAAAGMGVSRDHGVIVTLCCRCGRCRRPVVSRSRSVRHGPNLAVGGSPGKYTVRGMRQVEQFSTTSVASLVASSPGRIRSQGARGGSNGPRRGTPTTGRPSSRGPSWPRPIGVPGL